MNRFVILLLASLLAVVSCGPSKVTTILVQKPIDEVSTILVQPPVYEVTTISVQKPMKQKVPKSSLDLLQLVLDQRAEEGEEEITNPILLLLMCLSEDLFFGCAVESIFGGEETEGGTDNDCEGTVSCIIGCVTGEDSLIDIACYMEAVTGGEEEGGEEEVGFLDCLLAEEFDFFCFIGVVLGGEEDDDGTEDGFVGGLISCVTEGEEIIDTECFLEVLIAQEDSDFFVLRFASCFVEEQLELGCFLRSIFGTEEGDACLGDGELDFLCYIKNILSFDNPSSFGNPSDNGFNTVMCVIAKEDSADSCILDSIFGFQDPDRMIETQGYQEVSRCLSDSKLNMQCMEDAVNSAEIRQKSRQNPDSLEFLSSPLDEVVSKFNEIVDTLERTENNIKNSLENAGRDIEEGEKDTSNAIENLQKETEENIEDTSNAIQDTANALSNSVDQATNFLGNQGGMISKCDKWYC